MFTIYEELTDRVPLAIAALGGFGLSPLEHVKNWGNLTADQTLDGHSVSFVGAAWPSDDSAVCGICYSSGFARPHILLAEPGRQGRQNTQNT